MCGIGRQLAPAALLAQGKDQTGAGRGRREYHFASTRFAEAVGQLPSFDGTKLRKDTVKPLPD